MAVVASATGAAVFGLSGVAAGLAGGALLGAGAGALYSGITGDGNILDSALTGALLGGAVGGLGAGFGPSSMVAGKTAPLTGAGALAPGAATTVSSTTPALTAAQTAAANTTPGFAYTAGGEMVSAAYPASVTGASNLAGVIPPPPAGIGAAGNVASGMTGKQMLATGLAGTTALSLLGSGQGKLSAPPGSPSYIRPYTYSSTPVPAGDDYPSPFPSTPLYNAQGNPILDTRERNYFDQTFTAGEPYRAANGGLMSIGGPVERMSMMNTAINPQGGMYPQGMIDKTQYALPTQRPTSMEVLDAGAQRTFAKGGIAGYAGGGMMGWFLRSLQESNKNSPDPTMRNFISFEGDAQNQMPTQAGIANTLPKFTYDREKQKYIPMADGGITYDAATQKYAGLPTRGGAPAGDSTPLSAELIAQLTPQYQAANPNRFAYDPAQQRYSAATPTMAQLNAYKAEQDRMAAAQQMDPFMGLSPFDNFSGGANGGLMKSYAMGGDVQGYNLGGYSDGGRLLKGPGDGVSDDIPAVIGNRQPARLADGEFVIPARIVSEIGNGSTDAGAKRLYAMMDRIQSGRKKTIGKNNVAKDTKAKKHLLA